MYKKRVRKWGLDKKNKEPEMRAIVRKTQRSGCGKSSIHLARGRRIEYKEVVRYWERRNLSIEDVIAQCNSREATPEALECLTPISSPVSTPAVLEVPERMLRSIRDYFCASFESGTWFSYDPADFCKSSKNSKSSIDLLARLCRQVSCASILFDRRKFQEAGQTLMVGTAGVKKILLAEDPKTVPYMLHLITTLYKKGHREVGTALMHQFIDLGSISLCPEHPIPRILALLANFNLKHMDDIAGKALVMMGVLFEHHLGVLNFSTLDLRSRYGEIVLRKRNPDDEGVALRDTLRRCDALLGVNDFRAISLRLRLAYHYYSIRDYFGAKRECLSLGQHSQGMGYSGDWVFMRAHALSVLGYVEFAIQNIDIGEGVFERSYRFAVLPKRSTRHFSQTMDG